MAQGSRERPMWGLMAALIMLAFLVLVAGGCSKVTAVEPPATVDAATAGMVDAVRYLQVQQDRCQRVRCGLVVLWVRPDSVTAPHYFLYKPPTVQP